MNGLQVIHLARHCETAWSLSGQHTGLTDLPLTPRGEYNVRRLPPDVIQLRDSQNLPGMRVLQFAFDGNPQNPHLPHNYVPNAVAYTATHDNNTTQGWFEALPEQQKQALYAYAQPVPVENRDAAPKLMRLAWSSSAALAIAPLQDLLNLGGSARMNTPGQPSGNWRWRITDVVLSPAAFDWLRDLTTETKRCPADFVRAESAAREEIEVTR